MSYFIVSFISPNDRLYSFVQNYRKKFDPAFYKIIDPHFTFSFFKKKTINDFDKFLNKIKINLKNIRSFNYELNGKILYNDNVSKSFSTLFTPTNIMPFYDIYYKIYKDKYSNFIKDETFIPGIPLTSDIDFQKAYINFNSIKTQKFLSTINSISIISFSNLKIKFLENIKLSSL